MESSLSLVAFLGLLGISAYTVVSLNPTTKNESDSGQVAGVETDTNQASKVQIEVSNLSEENPYFESEFKIEEGENKLILKFNELKKGEVSVPFIQLENSQNLNGNISIKAYMQSDLRPNLSIYLSDELDTLVLASPISETTSKLLTIGSGMSRQMNLNIDSTTDINYPFELEIIIE